MNSKKVLLESESLPLMLIVEMDKLFLFTELLNLTLMKAHTDGLDLL